MNETMKIRWAWIFPVLFIYRPGMIFGFPAYNFGFVVLSDIGCQESASLPAHELVHTKQVIATLGLHCLLYYASKRYRYWAELMAYRASIKHGLDPALAAELMATCYNFDKKIKQIKIDLGG